MTPEQRQLLQESWALMEPRGDELAAAFYARLFELDPRTQSLFAGTDMTAQRQKFIHMLGEIVRVMDDPDGLVPGVAELGRRHVGYGVGESDYETVGQALIWMFERGLEERFDARVRAAWAEGYRLLSSLMQRAITAERPLPRV